MQVTLPYNELLSLLLWPSTVTPAGSLQPGCYLFLGYARSVQCMKKRRQEDVYCLHEFAGNKTTDPDQGKETQASIRAWHRGTEPGTTVA
ncbi:hypothetical protein CHU98_g10070 [Xylaria longipes]|nr:hypothetical protein CHU98_g10070 [Xylaria longipes]